MILSFIERALTSILLSLLLAFLSFSYFTGNFPPRKQDLYRAIHLSRQMIMGTPALNQAGQKIQQAQAQGVAPNIEQMAEYQRMALRRTEITVELMKIFKNIKLGSPNMEMGVKLQRISSHLGEAEREMAEITSQLQEALGAGNEMPPTRQ